MELFCFKACGVLTLCITECFTERSESWQCSPWAVIPPWVGGETEAQSWLLVHRVQLAPKVPLPFGLSGSLCFLPTGLPSVLCLRCFNIFLPETNHLLIYVTDKKLCVQVIKAFFGCIHPYPSPLFSWWPFFDFYYLLRSGRIITLKWCMKYLTLLPPLWSASHTHTS